MSAIDPWDSQYHYRPIWCVYGPDSFPTVFCCQLTHSCGSLNVWGYSVYRRSPGFRTVGRELAGWVAEKGAVFFAEQSGALAHIAKLTTPKVKR
jgi:hypothetical protein